MKEIKVFFSKFIIPILLLVAGVYLLILSSETEVYKNVECGDQILDSKTVEQTTYFKYAAYAFLAVSIIAFLAVSGLIQRTLLVVLVAVILAVDVFYMVKFNIGAVEDEIAWKDRKQMVEFETKQRLKDIRNAQLEYKNKYGYYAPTFDNLVEFLKAEKVANIKKQGTPPDRYLSMKEAWLLGEDTNTFIIDERKITEIQAVKLGIIARDSSKAMINDLFGSNQEARKNFMELSSIVRDTNYVSVIEKVFTGPSAKKRVSDFEFSPDSLPYKPYSGKQKFWMKTDSIPKGEGMDPVFLVKDPKPFAKQYMDRESDCMPRDTLKMGSLSTTSTNGNWN